MILGPADVRDDAASVVSEPDAVVSRERDDLEGHRAPSSRSIVS